MSSLLRVKILKIGLFGGMYFSTSLRKYTYNTINDICINFTFLEQWHIEEVLEIFELFWNTKERLHLSPNLTF